MELIRVICLVGFFLELVSVKRVSNTISSLLKLDLTHITSLTMLNARLGSAVIEKSGLLIDYFSRQTLTGIKQTSELFHLKQMCCLNRSSSIEHLYTTITLYKTKLVRENAYIPIQTKLSLIFNKHFNLRI